jgi:hypothetical protein
MVKFRPFCVRELWVNVAMAGISLHRCGLPGTGERRSGGGPGRSHRDVQEVEGAAAELLEPPDQVHALQRLAQRPAQWPLGLL